jgi:hypothetical protein
MAKNGKGKVLEAPVEPMPKAAGDHLPATTSTAMPPALNSDRRGFEEEVDQSDLIIPRVKIMQPTCEELKEPGTELRLGQIINSLTKEPLSQFFVPIFYGKEYLRFNPRKKDAPGFMQEFKPGALIWKTKDKNDPRVIAECQFGPNGEPPLAIEQLSFFSLFEGSPIPVILSFGKTSYKAGKNLLSLAKLRGGAMFSRKYRLQTILVKKDEGDYYVLKVDPCGDVDAETFKTAESYFNQFGVNRASFKTHEEAAE